jgi:hypothetical protein
MVTVSKDGPYHITGGIELIGGDANNICNLETEHQKSIILFVVEHQRTCILLWYA